eukprot:5545509-Karenia_brevis.AAC.1
MEDVVNAQAEAANREPARFSWTAYLFSLNGFKNCKNAKNHGAANRFTGFGFPSYTAEDANTPSIERRHRALALWDETMQWREHAEAHEVEAWDWHVNNAWQMHADEISQRRLPDEHGNPTDETKDLAGMMWANLLATEAVEKQWAVECPAEYAAWQQELQQQQDEWGDDYN